MSQPAARTLEGMLRAAKGEPLDEALQLDLAMLGKEEERLREWLERARPEDLGKYTM